MYLYTFMFEETLKLETLCHYHEKIINIDLL
jgi:hypothetical protein